MTDGHIHLEHGDYRTTDFSRVIIILCYTGRQDRDLRFV